MEKSLYSQYISTLLPAVVLSYIETLNDSKNPQLKYKFRELLRSTYSSDGKWESLTGISNRVAADVIALDSSIPLKQRDTLQRASGNIAKLGIKFQLNENQMTEIDTMIAKGATIAEVGAKILNDIPRVIAGIMERLELMFLQGLSTGIALADTDNVGTGVRVDYGYYDVNKFGVAVLWATPATATPIDDIQKVINKALVDGNIISKVYMDTPTLNAMLNTTQMKQQYAFTAGFTGTNVPTPSKDQANVTLSSKFGFTVETIDRVVKTEKDGVRTSKKPFKTGTLVFTPEGMLGDLVWADLAEKNHPKKSVDYQTVESYILVSKYSETEPSFSESTKGQARAVPVIANVDAIYTLDSLTVQA